MDRIVTTLVKDLLDSQEIPLERSYKDFERFTNYCVISKEYNKSFDIEDTLTGVGDDTGIDGLAIIVNGNLIENTEQIEDLLERNNFIEATFVFIQAKTSNEFNSSEMNKFSFGVKDFFSDNPKLRRNSEILNFSAISEFLFTKASKFRENPKCKLYYVSNGSWKEDRNNVAIVNSTIEDLEKTNFFSTIEFNLLGANEISKLYRQTKNTISTSFVFTNKITLPDFPNINESYFGVIPILEFRKILIDENGNMRNIFYDNIRDFQGIGNPVNKKILETLNGDNPELFTVLNNGVTIVASSMQTSGNKFTIKDYQIVNGCQTSNVLFNHIKDNKSDEINIPLKLVYTTNDDVKNSIIIATNSQIAIKREQLQAMTDFQKNLEIFYNTYEGDSKLYYERRSGQYRSDNSIVKSKIINVRDQIKAFSSIFHENPDRVTTYFGGIVTQNIETENPTIFNSDHAFIPYYMSGLAFYRLNSLFKSNSIDKKFRKIKFFLLMIFRMLINKNKINSRFMNSKKKANEYCKPIIEILNNKDKCLEYFKKSTEIVEYSGLEIDDKQLIKQVSFTNKLKKAFREFESNK